MPPSRNISLPPIDTVPDSNDSTPAPDDSSDTPERSQTVPRLSGSPAESASVATRPPVPAYVAAPSPASASVATPLPDDTMDISGGLRGSQRASFGSLLGASHSLFKIFNFDLSAVSSPAPARLFVPNDLLGPTSAIVSTPPYLQAFFPMLQDSGAPQSFSNAADTSPYASTGTFALDCDSAAPHFSVFKAPPLHSRFHRFRLRLPYRLWFNRALSSVSRPDRALLLRRCHQLLWLRRQPLLHIFPQCQAPEALVSRPGLSPFE